MASAEDKNVTPAEAIDPREAIDIVLDPLHKALDRTMLLNPNEFNSQAVKTLLKCHTTVAQRIPGASDKIISDVQVTQSVSENAYKNQIRQGQTIFAAPGGVTTSSQEAKSSISYTKQ